MKTAVALRVFAVLLFIAVFAVGVWIAVDSLGLGSSLSAYGYEAAVGSQILEGVVAMLLVWLFGSIPGLILLGIAQCIVLLNRRLEEDYNLERVARSQGIAAQNPAANVGSGMPV